MNRTVFSVDDPDFCTWEQVLNLHTAFYDGSGDLQGLHPAGRVRGIWNILACNSGADLKRLYTHYARGWMIIDVVSVFPFGTVYSFMSGIIESDDAGSARVLKVRYSCPAPSRCQ